MYITEDEKLEIIATIKKAMEAREESGRTFKHEILKKYEDRGETVYVGSVFEKDTGVYAFLWTAEGYCWDSQDDRVRAYDLDPSELLV